VGISAEENNIYLSTKAFRLPDKWLCTVLFFALAYAAVLAFAFCKTEIHWDEVNHLNGALLLSRGQIWDYASINSFYPPLYNVITAAYFIVAGASVFTARLVTLTFTVASILLVYKTAKEMYSQKVGLLASVFFAVMPGTVWLSGLAMIETMLIFMVSLSLLFFFRWLQTSNKFDLMMSSTSLVLGVLVKYQTLVVVPLVMLTSLLVLGKIDVLKTKIRLFLFSRLIWLGGAIAIIGGFLLYAYYTSGLLKVWLYAIQFGNVGQSEYSLRFPVPIFYLVEIVWPYSDMHPVSLLLYVLALVGLIFFVVRRKPQDKYLLIWFIATYVIFTIIPNRQWRYVTLVFPVLAISAAELAASLYYRTQKIWRATLSSVTKKRIAKLSAGFLIVFVVAGVFYSAVDAYVWVSADQIQVPTEDTANYISQRSLVNGSVLVLCPFNRFNKDIILFYLNSKSASPTQVYQYPTLAVDAYPPDFNITELVSYCQTNDTKYVLLYEYESTPTYYGSNLNEQALYTILNDTGKFSLEVSFGVAPRRMFVFSFNGSSQL